jgi:hypothetical protein
MNTKLLYVSVTETTTGLPANGSRSGDRHACNPKRRGVHGERETKTMKIWLFLPLPHDIAEWQPSSVYATPELAISFVHKWAAANDMQVIDTSACGADEIRVRLGICEAEQPNEIWRLMAVPVEGSDDPTLPPQ